MHAKAMRTAIACVASWLMWISMVAVAQTPMTVEPVAQDLTVPWDLVWGPDNHIWCMERTGRITRIHPDNGTVEVVHQLEDVFQSWDNSGAHSMILHPDFPRTPYIYVNYTHSEFRGRLSCLRYSVQHGRVVDEDILIPDFRGNTSHNGSRMQEGPDGYLYMTMGDAYNDMSSQDETSLSGKVLPMDWAGQAAPDNPFGNRVYSTGHRNPQGLVFSPEGRLYLSEHGPATDDEVNLVERGRNYGWPLIEGPCDDPEEAAACAELDAVDPLAAWTPTLAPCGMEYFDHPSRPEWQGSLLLTFLKKQHLRILHLDETGTTVKSQDSVLYQQHGRLRDVLVAPNGRVFVATSNQEINGWQFLAVDEDDQIFELINPDFDYEPLTPVEDLEDLYFLQLAEFPQDHGVVFPQPAKEGVTMFLPEEVESVTVRLFDASGRLAMGAEPHALAQPGMLHVWLGDVRPGMYVMDVRAADGSRWTSKVLVQRH